MSKKFIRDQGWRDPEKLKTFLSNSDDDDLIHTCLHRAIIDSAMFFRGNLGPVHPSISILLKEIKKRVLNPNVPNISGHTPLDSLDNLLNWREREMHGHQTTGRPQTSKQRAQVESIRAMLLEAIESYDTRFSRGATTIQTRQRGNISRLQSKSEGKITKKQKKQDWPELKKRMKFAGFGDGEIDTFYKEHYMASKKKKKKNLLRKRHLLRNLVKEDNLIIKQ